ncbi:MAG TPA: hypothetical protein DCO75_12445 [Fibrobacteres bacterium]|jgi:GDP-4-dehydro-6-deoxy-D-mannose reductase|nr:hypothetical protein [Fibrobacterota bacterium]
MSVALITGVNGFVGRLLAEKLSANNRHIVGIDIQDKSILPDIQYFKADICDIDIMANIFSKTQPQEIYHLAAVSSPSYFHTEPFNSFRINLMGSISLFEVMKKSTCNSVMLAAGSAKQYQEPAGPGPVTESGILNPSGYYGMSKYAVEMIGRYYVQQHDLDIRFTRSFNHTGPGQANNFVCSDWARQVALIALGMQKPEISVGNIKAAIDFTDVRDVIEAYRLIVQNGKKGEAYNVCNGKGIDLKYILDYLTKKCPSQISICVKQEKFDVTAANAGLIGNYDKLHKETGWNPQIPIEKTLDDIYAWWVNNLR